MKKAFLLIASAALLFAGCQKEQIAQNTGNDGDQVTVTFTAGLAPEGTKAVIDGDGAAANVNHWVLEVYDNEGLFYEVEKDVTAGTPAALQQTYELKLFKNQAYTLLFWADTKGAYTTADLTAVSTVGSVANNDSRDAFYAKVPYTSLVSESKNVTLTRPFAQLNIITNDLAALKAKVATDAYGKYAPADLQVKATVPTTFNLMTETAGGAAEQTLTAAASYGSFSSPGSSGTTLFMDYIFASTSKELKDMKFSFTSNNNEISYNFTNIPLQRNYRTNIKGQLMSNDSEWTVTIDPAWDSGTEGENDYNVYYYEASSISAAQQYIQNNDSQESKTVDLSKATIAQTDVQDDGTIKFELKQNSPADQVNFTLPAIPSNIEGCTGWKITNDGLYQTQNVNVTAPQGTSVIIDAPISHVTLNGATYQNVTATTGPNTLVVPAGITIANLTVNQGAVEIHGTVNSLTVTPNEGKKVLFRACEGLSATVFEEIYKEGTTTNYLDPMYTYKLVGEKYDIYKLPVVAMIGNVEYPSLAAAIAAVDDDETINVMTDVDNAKGIKVNTEKTFTVDFGGHTYTVNKPGAGSKNTETQAFQLLKDQTITFKNGTIKCAEENKEHTWATGDSNAEKGIAMMIQNYANLTLEDMTIDATNIAHNGVAVRYALSNNSGNVEYKGATSIITVAGDYAFDVCKFDTYAAPTVTWNSTGDVTGIIELSGGNFVVAKDLKVTTPIRANSGVSTMTINESVVVSPVDAGFGTAVKTKFAETSDETQKGVVVVNRGGNLTVKGKGTIDAIGKCYSAITLTEKGEDDATNAAKLTIESANSSNITLTGGIYYAISGNGKRGNTDVTIKKGIFNAPNGFCIYQPQLGNLTISDGTFNGYTCIGIKSGNVTISSGTFTASGASKEYKYSQNGIEETGQAIIIDNCNYPGGEPVVNITGGTFVSEHNTAVGNYFGGNKTAAITGFISGGTYSSQAEEAWLNASLALEQYDATSGRYVYSKTVPSISGSGKGSKTYNLKLLKDYTCNGWAVGNNLATNITATFDLGGHTLSLTPTAKNQGITIGSKGNNVTLKNGTVKVTTNAITAIAVKNYDGNVLTLANDLVVNTVCGGVLIDGPGVLNCAATINNTENCAAIQTNGKTSANSIVNITGGTITSPDVAIYHPAGTLNISGGSISGTTGVYVKSGTTTISGGTITGNGEKKAYQFYGNGCYATGDALVVDNCGYLGEAPSVTLTNTVTAGTLVSTNASQIGNYYGNGQTEAATITNNSGVQFSTRTNE